MSANATSVGLDVHARSVVACGLDGRTGELFERRSTPDHREILGWIRALPGPVAATYEAGPSGFGLPRFLSAEGVDCQVARRPVAVARTPGDRSICRRSQHSYQGWARRHRVKTVETRNSRRGSPWWFESAGEIP